MKEISIVPRDGVMPLWQTVEPMLARAIARAPGRWETVDVLVEILSGRQSLWIVLEETSIIAAFTTAISKVPAGLVCTSEWLGGEEAYEWFDDAVEIVEAYAKDVGCIKVEAHGRKGWFRYLKDHGWKQLSVVYEKDLV